MKTIVQVNSAADLAEGERATPEHHTLYHVAEMLPQNARGPARPIHSVTRFSNALYALGPGKDGPDTYYRITGARNAADPIYVLFPTATKTKNPKHPEPIAALAGRYVELCELIAAPATCADAKDHAERRAIIERLNKRPPADVAVFCLDVAEEVKKRGAGLPAILNAVATVAQRLADSE